MGHPGPPAPLPALKLRAGCRDWCLCGTGMNLIFIDFLSLLKGNTPCIETNQNSNLNDKLPFFCTSSVKFNFN